MNTNTAIKGFEHLKFEEIIGKTFISVQAKEFFENGYGISVLQIMPKPDAGSNINPDIFLSNNEDASRFEVAVIIGSQELYKVHFENAVMAGLLSLDNKTASDIDQIMKQIQELPALKR